MIVEMGGGKGEANDISFDWHWNFGIEIPTWNECNIEICVDPLGYLHLLTLPPHGFCLPLAPGCNIILSDER